MSAADFRPDFFSEAFSRWWSEDYSIEGLKTKLVAAGGGQITLYDYWVRSGISLKTTTFAGREWTIFHLPTEDLSGAKSSKASWSAQQIEHFYKSIEKLELAGSHAHNEESHLPSYERSRAYFNGIVFPPYDRTHHGPHFSPVYEDAIFEGQAHFDGHSSYNGMNFKRAIFRRHGQFHGRNFQGPGDTIFDGSTFCAHAVFTASTFSTPLSFRNVRLGATNFSGTHFQQEADFSRTLFGGKTLHFQSGTSARTVLDDVVFDSDVSFLGRVFNGEIRSTLLTAFSGTTSFRDCEFKGPVRLSGIFAHIADFSSKADEQFHEDVSFYGANFRDDVDFNGSRFRRPLSFIATTFKTAPQFHGATPHPSTTFIDCKFEGKVGDPDPITFAISPLILDRLASVAVGFNRSDKRFDEMRSWIAKRLSTAKSGLFRQMPFAEWLPGMRSARGSRNASTAELESSYRTLRNLLESDPEQSARFYGLEMDARRRRTDVSIVERWVLFLFAVSSGYGRYLGLPLVILAVALALMTVVTHAAMSASISPVVPTFSEAWSLTWRFFLLPTPIPMASDGEVLKRALAFSSSWPYVYSSLSALCALTTTALAGVTLVTLRRRFALK